MGRYIEAEEYYQQALEIKNDYADAHADYAFLLGNLMRYNESERHYLKAIEIKQKDAEWADIACLYGELGAYLRRTGQIEAGRTHYAKVYEISTRIANARLRDLSSNDLARLRESLKKSD